MNSKSITWTGWAAFLACSLICYQQYANGNYLRGLLLLKEKQIGDLSLQLQLRSQGGGSNNSPPESVSASKSNANGPEVIASVEDWVLRLDDLKKAAASSPELAIPEMGLLTTNNWIEASRNARLDSELGRREAISGLRNSAKNSAAIILSDALTRYLKENGGSLPKSVADLDPYTETPLDERIFGRYKMIASGNIADVRPGQWLIEESSTVDPYFDTQLSIGKDKSFSMTSVRKLQEAVELGVERYNIRNGKMPSSSADIEEYIKARRLKPAEIEKMFKYLYDKS